MYHIGNCVPIRANKKSSRGNNNVPNCEAGLLKPSRNHSENPGLIQHASANIKTLMEPIKGLSRHTSTNWIHGFGFRIRLLAPFSRLKPWARTQSLCNCQNNRWMGQASLSRIWSRSSGSKKGRCEDSNTYGNTCRHLNAEQKCLESHYNCPMDAMEWMTKLLNFYNLLWQNGNLRGPC